MKKILLILAGILIVAIGVFFVVKGSGKVENKVSDFDIVFAAMENDPTSNEILATGSEGDILVKVKATEELKKLAAREKNSRFLSTEQPKQYIQDGYVLINIVPFEAMKKFKLDLEHGCHYRIFFGSIEDMNYDTMYAVELCRE